MLVPQAALVRIFRARFRDALRSLQVHQALPLVDPAVWQQPWGVHLQSFGSGETLIKYLGAYVCRTAIGDSRIMAISDHAVSFRWKDRARGGVSRVDPLPEPSSSRAICAMCCHAACAPSATTASVIRRPGPNANASPSTRAAHGFWPIPVARLRTNRPHRPPARVAVLRCNRCGGCCPRGVHTRTPPRA